MIAPEEAAEEKGRAKRWPDRGRRTAKAQIRRTATAAERSREEEWRDPGTRLDRTPPPPQPAEKSVTEELQVQARRNSWQRRRRTHHFLPRRHDRSIQTAAKARARRHRG